MAALSKHLHAALSKRQAAERKHLAAVHRQAEMMRTGANLAAAVADAARVSGISSPLPGTKGTQP